MMRSIAHSLARKQSLSVSTKSTGARRPWEVPTVLEERLNLLSAHGDDEFLIRSTITGNILSSNVALISIPNRTTNGDSNEASNTKCDQVGGFRTNDQYRYTWIWSSLQLGSI